MPVFSYLSATELEAISRYVLYGEEKEVERGRHLRSGYESKYFFAGYDKFLDPDGYPAMNPPWGTLNALDLDSGERRWQIPLGGVSGVRTSVGCNGFATHGGAPALVATTAS